ncbi:MULTISPECIES: hypothetical protein [unclassified Anabaena]|uniref:hypothetical protein n=1 Tax=unclassified Anabaena TaxID=2619674 RepID=UPI00082C3BF5|nr:MULTISPECIES: hypothetical protein [unclassified Anabaena]
MLGFLFGGLVKKFESAAKEIVSDCRDNINGLFDDKLYPLADKLDYIIKERIHQAIEDTEKLENKTKVDIYEILNTADAKIKHYLETIDNIRAKAISETINQTNFYLENRINQMALAVMEAINNTHDSLDKSLDRIEKLESNLFRDANQIVDKLCECLDRNAAVLQNELRKYLVHALPSPLDKCKQKLKISWKPGGMFSDIELYELNECYELSKLNENTPVDEVLKIYGQLQHNATIMAALVSKSPELKHRAIQDWIKYGLLCEFWRSIIKTYDAQDSLMLETNSSPKLLQDNPEV